MLCTTKLTLEGLNCFKYKYETVSFVCFLFSFWPKCPEPEVSEAGGKKSHILKPGEHISHTLILTTLSSSVAKTYCMPRPLYCTVILSFVSTNAYTHPQMHADRKEFLLMLTCLLPTYFLPQQLQPVKVSLHPHAPTRWIIMANAIVIKKVLQTQSNSTHF